MQNNNYITIEDIFVTEELVSDSYHQLKQSILQIPSQIYTTIDQAVRNHPILSIASILVAGGMSYEIFNKTSSSIHINAQNEKSSDSSYRQPDTPILNNDVLMVIIPLLAPYILELVKQCIEDTSSNEDLTPKI